MGTRIQAGDKAPKISLPSVDGQQVSLEQFKGQRVIFTFFRFASCPFCNIRIDRLTKRWSEFPEGTVMIGVFDADVDELRKRIGKRDVPFILVADSTYEHFERHGVVKSFGRFMWGAVRSPLTFMAATLKGYFPRTLSLSRMSTIPVDLLIDEEGIVAEAHYCKDTADHLSIEKMVAFARGE
ncbi:MAG: hypothetical protein CMA08_01215 [Euryarchaeota archaeon]|nr:hypothetical protein [Euryarchaeota archaeon]OUX22938.1 MAG: hypothetical protein CBE12_01125 [Euryarchaeota archaeon TMED252]DAC37608.1 MAG TPA: hypothetical protein D7H96_01335 [Candidatus Poseidoniales archaeon]HIH52903.1 redoxin domain-containing protein [Candidatus Poseidoniaceae archaeon]